MKIYENKNLMYRINKNDIMNMNDNKVSCKGDFIYIFNFFLKRKVVFVIDRNHIIIIERRNLMYN